MASELGIAHAIFVQKQHEQDKANESALNEKVLESRNRLLGTEPISYGPGRSIVGQSTMNGSFAESKTVAEARKGTMDKALAAYRLSQRGHFHKSGFDDKTVMSDMRFKVSQTKFFRMSISSLLKIVLLRVILESSDNFCVA